MKSKLYNTIYDVANKLSDFMASFCPWKEKRAKKVLDYIVARVAVYDDYDDTYYFYLRDFEAISTAIVPAFDAHFVKRYSYKLSKYLLSDKYQVKGYTKEVCGKRYDDMYVAFSQNVQQND